MNCAYRQRMSHKCKMNPTAPKGNKPTMSQPRRKKTITGEQFQYRQSHPIQAIGVTKKQRCASLDVSQEVFQKSQRSTSIFHFPLKGQQLYRLRKAMRNITFFLEERFFLPKPRATVNCKAEKENITSRAIRPNGTDAVHQRSNYRLLPSGLRPYPCFFYSRGCGLSTCGSRQQSEKSKRRRSASEMLYKVSFNREASHQSEKVW